MIDKRLEHPSRLEEHMGLSQANVRTNWLGAGFLLLTTLGVVFFPGPAGSFGHILENGSFEQAHHRLDTLLIGVFLTAFCLVPAASYTVRLLRPKWKDVYTYGCLFSLCVFLSVFFVHFGRWQFGGYDFNVLIETGWRQILGQKPYVDFPTTTAPGFNLGIEYAFRLFGVNWDANLYFGAAFGCFTFLWLYWLMRQLSIGRAASAGVALAIECAGLLTLCFWWYNDSALILAAVFFLSCLLYIDRSDWTMAQCSYVSSLALLSLMKPNMAGLTIAGGVVVLFLVTRSKLKLIVLTLAAALAAVGFLLINRVSIPSMLASYLNVGREHGMHTSVVFRQASRLTKAVALIWIAILSVPLAGLLPRMKKQLTDGDWRGLALSLFYPFAAVVAVYGLLTNGEHTDVECTVLLAAGGVLAFGSGRSAPLLRRTYIAILCASIVSNLYFGATRQRVYGIGEHLFFEWDNNEHRIESGFLRNMRVSSTMINVEREVRQALNSNPGPYFFGPRLDFNYAVLGLPSPEHSPAWWQPGTAFGVADSARLVQVWQSHRFQTLIFLKASSKFYPTGWDDTYYTPGFLEAIERGYLKDESYAEIVVFHRSTT